MKKYFLMLGLVGAALSFTNCSNDLDEAAPVAPAGHDFKLYAAPATRTASDGLNTKWVADDKINVFHAAANGKDYVSDGAFSIAEADLSSGTFKGTISDAEFDASANHDWYVLYPYNSESVDPTASKVTIPTVQYQTGVDNWDTQTPLMASYGVAKNTATPSVKMKHLTSMIEVNVKNTSEIAAKVTKITLSAETVDLSGSFDVDVTAETPVYTSVDAKTEKSATLVITGENSLTTSESGNYYLSIKPVTLPEGEVLTLTITANGRIITKTMTVPAGGLSFNSGEINPVAVKIAPKAAKWMKVTSAPADWSGEYLFVTEVIAKNVTTTPTPYRAWDLSYKKNDNRIVVILDEDKNEILEARTHDDPTKEGNQSIALADLVNYTVVIKKVEGGYTFQGSPTSTMTYSANKNTPAANAYFTNTTGTGGGFVYSSDPVLAANSIKLLDDGTVDMPLTVSVDVEGTMTDVVVRFGYFPYKDNRRFNYFPQTEWDNSATAGVATFSYRQRVCLYKCVESND